MMMSGETSGVADIAEILRLSPHRYPFLLIDRVIDIRGEDHGIGIKNLTMNEPQFEHSLQKPVMPGVLVIEGIAQTAAVLALRLMAPTERPRTMFFMTINKAKFRKPVGPGNTIEYHVDKVARRRNMWWYRGEANVGSVSVAEAELGACLAND
jgi:3-hydroxyacyl-[acyl-carrier-protein] dehydratase